MSGQTTIFPKTFGHLLALSSRLLSGNSAPTPSADLRLGQNDSAAVGKDAEPGLVVTTGKTVAAITYSEPGAADTAVLSQPRPVVAPAFGCGHRDCVTLTVHESDAVWLLELLKDRAAVMAKRCKEEQAKRGFVPSVFKTSLDNAMHWIGRLEEELGIE